MTAPFLRSQDGVVARRSNRRIPQTGFQAEIEELADQLPDRGFVVNLCGDRYQFAVAWAAAMMRGQITLLPTGRDAAALAAVCLDYPAAYILTDDEEPDDLPARRFAYPAGFSGGHVSRTPCFAMDQIAAVLFTSGSTGRPSPNLRRWGRLVAGTLAAGAALGIERHRGAAVVATVPHAHSYGLESAIMLPLQHGLLLTADRPFFAADVAAALAGEPAGVLVTTPVHLRALVGGADATMPMRAGFVLSATAPLSADLASLAEIAFEAPVFEIYGCSEAGQLATRCTTDGEAWHMLDGFHLRQDATASWAGGPYEADAKLADELDLLGGGDFILRGRTADMVNVAGKRSSIAWLSQQLTGIPGVQDGVFLMPPDAAAGVPTRLAAIAVAPGLEAEHILDALRGRIDAAFLPRPLRIVEALPRDALGKLPRSELLRLIVEPGRILLRIPADHPALPGHFPGNPVVPGAVLLDSLMAALFPDDWRGTIEAAKFHHPLRFGETVGVTHHTAGEATRFEVRHLDSGLLILSGTSRAPSASR